MLECEVERLSWVAVERRVRAGAIGVLPIGAASKEHGPHLPLGTDAMQALAYARALAPAHDILIWPVVGYGYYPVFTEYPGSISLSETTFSALVSDIVDGIIAAGAGRVVLLNTGISTIAPLETMLRARADKVPVQLLNCYAGVRFASAVNALEEQAFGGHADEIETSLMLAIEPDLVTMADAVAAPAPIIRGRFNRSDPTAANYSPAGINGDPTRASRGKGEQLLAALIADLDEALKQAGDAPREAGHDRSG